MITFDLEVEDGDGFVSFDDGLGHTGPIERLDSLAGFQILAARPNLPGPATGASVISYLSSVICQFSDERQIIHVAAGVREGGGDQA